MTHEEEIIRGGKAREILDSEVFQEISAEITDSIQRQMMQVGINNVEMHTKLIMMLQLWRTLRTKLEHIQQTGEMADFTLEQKRKGIFG